MGVITLSRQHGAGGEEIGEIVAARMGYTLISREEIEDKLIRTAGKEIPDRILGEKRPGVLERLTVDLLLWKSLLMESILSFAKAGNVLIIGRGGFKILKDVPGVLHILATGTRSSRSKHISSREGIPEMDAAREIERSDRERTGFLQYFFDATWPDPSSFHISIAPHLLGPEKTAEAVGAFIDSLNPAREYEAAGKSEIETRFAIAAGTNRIVLSAGIAPDLFHLSVEGNRVIGIRFYAVPEELREKSLVDLRKFLKDYTVRPVE